MIESKKENRFIFILPINIMKPICLTIAGSDPTSGAGIQADIRTFDRCGVHPFSVITAITYQTVTEFFGYKSLSDELDKQLETILTVYPIKYVKIGMIPDVKALDIIVNYIKKYDLNVVLDPILTASAGERLSGEGLELEIERALFPYVKIITPNISEASYFSNSDISNIKEENLDDLKKAAEILMNKLYIDDVSQKIEKAVAIKSAGSNHDEIFDLVLVNKKSEGQMKKVFHIFKKKKVPFEGNVHGTGCVFSSAIAAFLAKEFSIEEAIVKAESFFDDRFLSFIELHDKGKVIDLTISDERLKVINQIKEVYHFMSQLRSFSKFIPEVRMNISGSLPNAKTKEDVAGVEGRISIVNGFPKASGEIKFGVSDHTARLILSAKKFENSINFVMNLKYNPNWIIAIQENTDLQLKEIIRKDQPEEIKKKEFSTMQWLIKESIENFGKIPDIIWDIGSQGKEPMMRLFGNNSKEMIEKLEKIMRAINNE
ncbi:MAG: bifunctional hydroxymethylpyrimidine kinase/phosphomethylpyrimidine kinase [Candidatus Lokiarchaeota archaeon]|nr:bifunctional hydroxymethylpyrimidine kinase/phosphomethylpyrimidine kinase [Candidatus Lokiarchaeota archaeon]